MSSPGAGGAVALPAELVDFVESGVSILVGTRDAQLRPEAVRAVGCTVGKDLRTLSIVLNAATSRRTIANLEAGSPMAVTFNRPIDHRSMQVKGPCLRLRTGTAADDEGARRYLAAFADALYLVGVSRATARRVRGVPCMVAELEVRELFEQTPGPVAGNRLEAR